MTLKLLVRWQPPLDRYKMYMYVCVYLYVCTNNKLIQEQVWYVVMQIHTVRVLVQSEFRQLHHY